MSTNATVIANAAVEAFVAGIKPGINELFLGTVWAAVLIPLLGILFFLSTPATRRMPIFLMNVFTVTMGIILGIVNLRIYLYRIYHPFSVDPRNKSLQIGYMAMILFLPMIMDCILAYRLTAVFPRRITAKRILAVIFLPVFLLKVARITNGLIFMVAFGTGDWNTHLFQILWVHKPYIKIEWILQVIDNCFTSSLFLWQLWVCQSRQKNSGRVSTQTSAATQGASTIKRLFYLALSSFVFPCVFSIIQVGIAFHDPDFFLASYLFIVNIYFEIICVLFATIWAMQTRAEQETNSIKTQTSTTLSSIAYRTADTQNSTNTHITRFTETTVELSDLDERKV